MKTSRTTTMALLIAALVLAFPALGNMYVYPARGQTPEQQQQDEGACDAWATQQTGFNPAQPPPAVPPPAPPPAPVGGLVRGGARGAALGAIGGAIGGDAGKGAAIGATTGALVGGIRRRDQLREQEYEQQQRVQQQQTQTKALQQNWEKAYTTCLTGRGYSVG